MQVLPPSCTGTPPKTTCAWALSLTSHHLLTGVSSPRPCTQTLPSPYCTMHSTLLHVRCPAAGSLAVPWHTGTPVHQLFWHCGLHCASHPTPSHLLGQGYEAETEGKMGSPESLVADAAEGVRAALARWDPGGCILTLMSCQLNSPGSEDSINWASRTWLYNALCKWDPAPENSQSRFMIRRKKWINRQKKQGSLRTYWYWSLCQCSSGFSTLPGLSIPSSVSVHFKSTIPSCFLHSVQPLLLPEPLSPLTTWTLDYLSCFPLCYRTLPESAHPAPVLWCVPAVWTTSCSVFVLKCIQIAFGLRA